MRRYTLIFPVSGQKDSFRPLDTVSGEPIAHRALRSFVAARERIQRVVFVYTEAEEARFGARAALEALGEGLPVSVVLLPGATSGPAETVARGVELAGIGGAAIVCDIDHRLGLAPLLDAAEADPGNAFVATWPLVGESLKRWAVGCVDGKGRVTEVAERQLPRGSGSFVGLIGCYVFPEIGETAERIVRGGHARFPALFNAKAAAGQPIHAVPLTEAEFFGDVARIRAIEVSESRFSGTIFCDIDGTLLEHEDVPSYAELPRLLDGSREKLARWAEDGYYIVLCTARKAADEQQLAEALEALEVHYHKLICGLPSGPRVLINDRKPSAIFTAQAHSFEIVRNAGITALELPTLDHPAVLRRFEGGSFAETLLLEQDGLRWVRKRAHKHDNLAAGYARLRAQFRTVERFQQMCPGIVPALLGEHDNSHEYYYDMEYLEGYRQLNLLPAADQPAALGALLSLFERHVYSHQNRQPGAGEEWFEQHLEQKIYAKWDAMAAVPLLRPLLSEGAVIDGVRHPGLEQLMRDACQPALRSILAPQFLSIAHGDFTFQNVMVGPDAGQVKVIDMESAGTLEAIELDLGKLLQSVWSQYDDWHLAPHPLTRAGADGIDLLFVPQAPDAAMEAQLRASWSRLLLCSPDMVDIKGAFYLGLHLVRMVPFRLKESEDQALYALATALQWLDRALTQAREL